MAPVLLADACFAAEVLPANPSCQNAVFAQRLVLMERLITERQAVHPLCHPFGHAVFVGLGVAIVGETPGKAIEQPDALIHLAEQ